MSEVVEKFTYHGIYVNADGGTTDEMNLHLMKTRAAPINLDHLLCHCDIILAVNY